jgi:hypothetical protein
LRSHCRFLDGLFQWLQNATFFSGLKNRPFFSTLATQAFKYGNDERVHEAALASFVGELVIYVKKKKNRMAADEAVRFFCCS